MNFKSVFCHELHDYDRLTFNILEDTILLKKLYFLYTLNSIELAFYDRENKCSHSQIYYY